MKKVLMSLVVAVAVVGIASAQGGGRQGGQGGGRQGMMGMGRQGGGDPSGLQLLNRADVAKDLALTAEQKDSAAKLNAAMRDEMQALAPQRGGGGRGGDGGGAGAPAGAAPAAQQDAQAAMKARNDIQAKYKAEVKKLLTETQFVRLGEIRIQLAGASALMDADVQKALGMSQAQIDKVKAAQDMQRQAVQEQMEKMRASGERPDPAAIQAAQKESNDAMLAVLTADQQAKFKAMQGKEFKADAPAAPQGGGRGGRGGGIG